MRVQDLFADKVTGAWVIATDAEIGRADVVRRVEALRHVVPSLRVMRAANVRVEGVSIPVGNRTAFNLAVGRRHCYMEAATPAEVGIMDSHIRVWREAAAAAGTSPAGWTLVFESDATPSPTGFKAAAADAPIADGPDAATAPCMVLLGFHNTQPPFRGRGTPTAPTRHATVLAANIWLGQHAYAVRNRDAQALIDAVLPMDSLTDTAVGIARALGTIPPVWTVRRSVFTQPLLSPSGNMHGWHLKTLVPANDALVIVLAIVPWAVVAVLGVALALAVAQRRTSARGRLPGRTQPKSGPVMV
jgi:hypothetical protein